MRKKSFLIIGIVLLCVLFIGGIIIGNYFYELALNPLTDKSVVFEAEHNHSNLLKGEEAWFQSIGYEETNITSEDDLKLHSYVLKNEDSAHHYVIIAHGYTSDASQMSAYAREFYEQGYHVVIPDARGHGESEGTYIGMGWDERKDMLLWINEIVSSDKEAEIVLFGVSMGAATVMSASGEDLPTQVKAIIEDCGYTSAKGIFSYQLKQLYNLPSFPILNFTSIVSYFKAGYTLGEVSIIDQVANAKTPILFIHGNQDAFVPYEMVYDLYEAANVEKELLIVEGAGHSESALVAGELYWGKVFNFINSNS